MFKRSGIGEVNVAEWIIRCFLLGYSGSNYPSKDFQVGKVSKEVCIIQRALINKLKN